MVKTVRPKASDTPANPIPSPGKPAASTALPQPPNTNQNVPMNSAVALLDRDICDILPSKGNFELRISNLELRISKLNAMVRNSQFEIRNSHFLPGSSASSILVAHEPQLISGCEFVHV